MKRPDDKQSPQGGADPAAAPVKGAPEAMSGLGELITGAACLSALILGLLVFGRRL